MLVVSVAVVTSGINNVPVVSPVFEVSTLVVEYSVSPVYPVCPAASCVLT